MIVNESAKSRIIEEANTFALPEDNLKEIKEKRNYFLTNFSAGKIATLKKDEFFQGKGKKQGNFTYELEWNSRELGSIGGGSVYKFGYEDDFDEIKKYLVNILSGKDSFGQFYDKEGELTDFSEQIVKGANKIKGIGRAFIGKVLSIYYPDIFLNIFGAQDNILKHIYDDFQPESKGVELYIKNNLQLLNLKKAFAPDLSNNEFSNMLYLIFHNEKADDQIKIAPETTTEFEALEVQHYQSLVHRNFKKLFDDKLSYFDPERQNDRSGHFDTQEVGIMDFLAIDKGNNFIVIELKRGSTDQTLGQTLRYMGWVRSNLCKNGQSVRGMIIAESKDNRLDYALGVTPNVVFSKMKLDVKISQE